MTTPMNQPSTSFAPTHLNEASLARDDGRPLPTSDYPIEANVPGIVNATLQWWFGDLKRLFLIGAIPFVFVLGTGVLVTTAVGGAIWGAGFSATTDSNLYVALLILLVWMGVAGVAYAAAAAGSVLAVEEHARGEPSLTAMTCFVHGLASMKRIIGFGVFAMAAYVAIAVVDAMMSEIVTPFAGAWATMLIVTVPTMLVMAYVGLRFTPIVAVYVIEELPVVAGIRRAWALTRGNVGMLFVAGLVVGLIGAFFFVILSVLALIPFLGVFVSFALLAIAPPVMHSYAFAAYAACLKRAG